MSVPFVLAIVVALMSFPVVYAAWKRAVDASLCSKIAVADADRAKAMYEEAMERLYAGETRPPLRPLPRRCALCGSARDPILTAFAGHGPGAKVAVFYCRDGAECAARRRALDPRRGAVQC